MNGAGRIVVDARGMRCPWPVLRLARAFREGRPGNIRLIADDPRATREVESFARANGWRPIVTEDGTNYAFEFELVTKP